MILHIQRKKYLYLSFNKSISKEKSYKRKYYLFLWMFWLDVLLFGLRCVCVYLIQHEVILSSLIKLTQQWVLLCTRTRPSSTSRVRDSRKEHDFFRWNNESFLVLIRIPPVQKTSYSSTFCHLWDLLYPNENSLNLIHVSLLRAWGFIKISRRFFGLLCWTIWPCIVLNEEKRREISFNGLSGRVNISVHKSWNRGKSHLFATLVQK